MIGAFSIILYIPAHPRALAGGTHVHRAHPEPSDAVRIDDQAVDQKANCCHRKCRCGAWPGQNLRERPPRSSRASTPARSALAAFSAFRAGRRVSAVLDLRNCLDRGVAHDDVAIFGRFCRAMRHAIVAARKTGRSSRGWRRRHCACAVVGRPASGSRRRLRSPLARRRDARSALAKFSTLCKDDLALTVGALGY